MRRTQIVVVLLLVTVMQVTGVQGICEVFHSSGIKKARCTNLDLAVVPQTLPRDILIIDLSQNRIQSLNRDSFRKYPNLQEVHIKHNKLRLVDGETFKPLLNLQYISMDHNQLTIVPDGAFHGLTSLKTLVLSNNLIQEIQNDAFNLEGLSELNLENNQISKVGRYGFRSLPATLTELNLASNKLTTLHEQTEKYFTQNLNRIRLYDNPWSCDCGLKWLREWLVKPGTSWEFGRSAAPLCSGPDRLKDKKWRILAPVEFACPPTVHKNTTTPSNTEAPLGETTSFNCSVSGAEPEAEIVWYKNGKELRSSTKYRIQQTGSNDLTNRLTVKFLKLNDTGNYVCMAKNLAGTDQTIFYLKVTRPSTDMPPPFKETLRVSYIIGIAVGTVLVFIIIVATIVCCIQRARKKRDVTGKPIQISTDGAGREDPESEKKPTTPNGYTTVQRDEPYNDPYDKPKPFQNDYQDYYAGHPVHPYEPRDYYPPSRDYNRPPHADYYPDHGGYYPGDGYTEASESYPPSDAPYYPPDQYYAPPSEGYHPPSSEGPEPYYPDYIPASHDELRDTDLAPEAYLPGMDYLPQGRATPQKPPRTYHRDSSVGSMASQPHVDPTIEGTAV